MFDEHIPATKYQVVLVSPTGRHVVNEYHELQRPEGYRRCYLVPCSDVPATELTQRLRQCKFCGSTGKYCSELDRDVADLIDTQAAALAEACGLLQEGRVVPTIHRKIDDFLARAPAAHDVPAGNYMEIVDDFRTWVCLDLVDSLYPWLGEENRKRVRSSLDGEGKPNHHEAFRLINEAIGSIVPATVCPPMTGEDLATLFAKLFPGSWFSKPPAWAYNSSAQRESWNALAAHIWPKPDVPAETPAATTQCTCHACIEEYDLRGLDGVFPLNATRMILCPTCGNKRCPHASDHRLECTKSNLPGQIGSIYQ